MLDFKKIEMEDIPTLKAYYSSYPARQCDRSVGATVMWRDYFDNRFTVFDGTIIFSSNFNGKQCFSFPVGRNIDGALKEIEKHCKEIDIPMILYPINSKAVEKLKETYENVEAVADRDWFDYLYEKDALLNLIGRKYATPRNHINKFRKLYADWSFEEINSSNIPKLIEFSKNFTFNSEKDESANLELKMCIEVLENYDAYGMYGGALRVDGKVIGYSIGEIIGDTLFCHIEKADISYAGAYQMLTNQYLRMYASGDEVKFVNREEDCGDEGLRKSKLSYHPVELIEKNVVIIGKD